MANIKITDLTAATALGGTELFETVQSGASVKASATQIQTFVGQSLTVSNATGSFSSITVTAGAIPQSTITGKVYGFFSSNRDQQYSANVNSVLSLDASADFNAGVSLVSSTNITFAAAGIYEINAAIQFSNTDSSDHDVTVWFRKNGNDIVGSASKVTIAKATDGGAGLLSISGIESFSVSSYIQCVANFESSLVIANYEAAVVGPPAIPSTPSVRISAKRVGL
jgi:hypothetical protein